MVQLYDNRQNYFQCLKSIVAGKRKNSRSELEAMYPLFVAKFPEMFDILFRRNVTTRDLMPGEKKKNMTYQKRTYDNNSTFAKCLFDLITETYQFGAVEKRSSDETMPEWVAWYESMMRKYPKFYDHYKTLMRKICEGRLQIDPVGCVLSASIDMLHRHVLTGLEQKTLFNAYSTRKGVFGPQIMQLRITEEEWEHAIEDFFVKNPQFANLRRA